MKHLLEALWSAAQETGNERDKGFAYHVEKTVENGCIEAWRIEDYLLYAGVPGHLRICARALPEQFGHSMEVAYHRPRSGKSEAFGFEALPAADFADVLMRLECFGIEAGAEPLASALRPPLTKRPMLTQSELSVYWYKKRCGRVPDAIAVKAGDTDDWPNEMIATGKVKLARFVDPANKCVLAACPSRWSTKRAEEYFLNKGFPIRVILGGKAA